MLFLTIAVFILSVSGIVQGRCIEALEADKLPAGITVHKVIRTWEEAQLHCKSEGAELASPLTTELLNTMRSVIGVNNTSYFIGTRASHYSGAYSSLEGVPLDNMTAAVMQMILQLDPREGDCLSMDLYSIRVVPCCVRRPFMCYTAPTGNNDVTTEESEVQAATEETEQSTSENKCGTHSEGYTYFASTGSCYKVHRADEKIWDDASATCEAEGGHLVVIDDENEATVIRQISFNDEGSPMYLGLHDYSGHGDWRSVTGKPRQMLYNVWQHGHPTGTPEYRFFCALLMASGKLDDYGCTVERPFICEI